MKTLPAFLLLAVTAVTAGHPGISRIAMKSPPRPAAVVRFPARSASGLARPVDAELVSLAMRAHAMSALAQTPAGSDLAAFPH